MQPLIHQNERGLFCTAGNFYIDPWQPVEHAVITHAHADHSKAGHHYYYAHRQSEAIMRRRLGNDIDFTGYDYNQPFYFNNVKVSLHSAGHILGSAQIRVEHNNDVWVVTGDFKRDADPTTPAFEPVECDTLITEATFSLPIYRWPETRKVAEEIWQWWQTNKEKNIASILFAYSLGKCQRILSELTHFTGDTVLLHGACVPLVDIYREQGVDMLPTEPVLVDKKESKAHYGGELIIAPPGASGSTWMRRFGKYETGFCSGWMQIRGNRRRRGYDRGFVVSDHADWPGLIRTIEESKARTVLATHGQTDVIVRYLQEQNVNARPLKTAFSDTLP